MKNDKDACRDSITESCGTELDYHCKKSGLYDFINETPISSFPFPYNCTIDNDDECFKWIDKHFVLSTIAVKPSAFSSFNLFLQPSMVKQPLINDPDHYCEPEISEINSDPTHINQLNNLYEDSKNMLKIYQSTIDSSGDIGMEYTSIDQETMTLYVSSNFPVTINFITSFLICIILLP